MACLTCGYPDEIENPDCGSCKPLPSTEVRLRVKIIACTFASPDQSYFIYRVRMDGPQPDNTPEALSGVFTVKGPVGVFSAGDIVLVSGDYSQDARFGFQIAVTTAGQLAIRESQLGLVTWLSRLPQVGECRARALLEKFEGLEGTLAVLDSDNASVTLQEVPGLTEDRCLALLDAYRAEEGYRAFRLFAASVALPEHVIVAALDAWDTDAESIIKEDPYVLLELDGVSFKKGDEYARAFNVDPEHPSRITAGVLACLEKLLTNGDVWIDSGTLAAEAATLGFTPHQFYLALAALQQQKTKRRKGQVIPVPARVVVDDGRVYLRELYEAECNLALHLQRLSRASVAAVETADGIWGSVTPAPEQQVALAMATSTEAVCVLVGGAGVGKTLITNTVLNALEATGLRPVLLAPTGKAAKRLTELTNRSASTIQRAANLARWSSAGVLDCGVLLIDEASMCDVSLLADLLSLTPTGTRVIFVGDTGQLPAIGPGHVLADMIESKLFPVTELTRIYRQADGTDTKRIASVGQQIRRGESFDTSVRGTDVVFVQCDHVDGIANKIVLATTEQIPTKYGYAPNDIQVLSPQRGDSAKSNFCIGVRGLNIALQKQLNPREPRQDEVHIGDGYVARVCDRVIQKKNNYTLGIVNGDLGTVTEVSKRGFNASADIVTSSKASVAGRKKASALITIVVDFPGVGLVGLTHEEAKSLQLAYSTTVHSSQGSGFTAIVIPLHCSHNFSWTRKMIYTALTRAESYVLLVGQTEVLTRAVGNDKGEDRNSNLVARLLQQT